MVSVNRSLEDTSLNGLQVITHFKATLGNAFAAFELKQCYGDFINLGATSEDIFKQLIFERGYHHLQAELEKNAMTHINPNIFSHLQLQKCQECLMQSVIEVTQNMVSSHANVTETTIKEELARHKQNTLDLIERLKHHRDETEENVFNISMTMATEEIERGDSVEDIIII
jgi:hypothetical protein